ncbi:hypothetical protein I306_06363 [Cryptococcus gattii EJB2]|uniref:Peptidase A2 domain-containing protein n=1 Tax=Cryptococcus gattii EJB2 TaxID=1296103 RepID=A0ABR5BM03_9TREE|nr:hypothetical protein I306_06363 [Cryptococcus gattii EJB2]
MLLRCLDTTPTAFDSFFHLLISYQAILRDFEDPLGDVDVCRRMLDGVDGLVTHRTKAALKANSQTVLTVNPADLHIIMINLIDDAMLEARFLHNSSCTRPPPNHNRPATHHLPPPVIAHVQVAPQAPKSYTPMQLEWLDPAKRLPLGEAGKAACMFLSSINTCFSCRQTGHHCLICPTCPLSSPPPQSLIRPHNPSSAPVTNLISLADDDYADAPGIFSVDPVAEQLVQDGATALTGSVPLIMVTCQVQANDDPATALVDSGAGINVIDQDGDEDGG